MSLKLFGFALVGLAGFIGPVTAQTIDRDNYHRHLPPMPRLVTQTDASARLHLYGDASAAEFRDHSPADGIDDARGLHLRRMAVRFAPILRRNNFSVPRFFPDVFRGRPVLQVDAWMGGRRIRTDSVLFYDTGRSSEKVQSAADDWTERLADSDALLLRLLEEQHPGKGASRVIRADGQEETVLFFDFPGHDAASWRSAYQDATDKGIYAHFFIHEDKAVPGKAGSDTSTAVALSDNRYSLVVQYWFFYPFNDSGNNHEGDWEHLAVLITTPERAAATSGVQGRLTEADLRRILDNDAGIADSLVIREVEYYFHESVVTLDYGADLTPPHTRWQEFKHLHVWESDDYIDNVIRERRAFLGGRLATHPIGYIGGNNKGPDELTNLWPRFQGSFNRNGHGTYPFAGTWPGVGPLGATEQVSGRTVPRLRKGLDPADEIVALDSLFEDDHFVSFDSSVVLLPDWERVVDLVLERPDARRAWAWLILPIRWGFPASASPGAGAVDHVDLGHIAPEGPSFQPTWNRLAGEGGFRHYRPRVLRALFSPHTPWDRLSSGWGFLNVPRTLLGFIPGWSVVFAQFGPWLTGPLEALGAPPNKTFAPERSANRFSSVGLGLHRQFGGEPFARLLPQPGDLSLSEASFSTALAHADLSSMTRDDATGMRAWINLHYGARLSVQNTFAQSSSTLNYTLLNADSSLLGHVVGTLEMKEITGGFRYRLKSAFGQAAQLFAGGGWGWTWYHVDNVAFQGEDLEYERKGGYAVSILPSARWWPNTWYGVVGLEVLAPRIGWVADRVGYGLQVEYTGLTHRLGATGPARRGRLGGVTRRELSIGAVVSW